MGLCWTHKTAQASLASLCLCLLISLFSLVLFNSVFSAYDYSYLMSVGWSPSIFPPLNLKELFQKLEYSAVIDNRCCCCQELVSPLLFHSLSSFYLPGSFFVLLVSFPVWYPILTFSPFKTILLSPLPSFVLSCFRYIYPISPLGYLNSVLFLHFHLSPSFTSLTPLCLQVCSCICCSAGRSWEGQTSPPTHCWPEELQVSCSPQTTPRPSGAAPSHPAHLLLPVWNEGHCK